MRAVGGAKRIVDIDLGQRSERLSQVGVVLCLAGFKADVFKHQQFAGLERGGFCFGVLADNILGHDHRLAEQLAQTDCDRRERKLRLEFSLRAAQMRTEDHSRAMLQKIFDGRQRRDNALVGGDGAVLERDVEITADEYFFAGDVDIFD